MKNIQDASPLVINLLHSRTKRKKKYCITKSSLQSSLQYSLQYSLQNSFQYSLQYSFQYSLQYSQIMLMFIALVYLLSLPLVFVYFLHITISLKIKNKPMKNKTNHQNDILCFRSYIINEGL